LRGECHPVSTLFERSLFEGRVDDRANDGHDSQDDQVDKPAE
jgi:hypothetical protein